MVARQPWLLIPAAALAVAGLAIGFAQITHQPADTVLFSGQDAFGSLIKQGTAVSLSTLAFLLLFKGLAWSISLGNFRGGPTFPALFIGAAGGLLAAHLPGFSETPAVAVLMAAAAVSILELPLSATIITLLLTSKAGIATAPLIIVAVVVAYITIQTLSGTRAPATPTPPATEPAARRQLPRARPGQHRTRVTPDPEQRVQWLSTHVGPMFARVRAESLKFVRIDSSHLKLVRIDGAPHPRHERCARTGADPAESPSGAIQPMNARSCAFRQAGSMTASDRPTGRRPP